MAYVKYVKGRHVTDILDFCFLLDDDARFITDDPRMTRANPSFYDRHPRARQAQTAGFMRVQQFWRIRQLIGLGHLYVAEKPTQLELNEVK